jgi:hypothetical protein
MTVANVQILLKRGNTTASSTYTGPLGEITLDTTLYQLRLHDGTTAGGILQADTQDVTAANVGMKGYVDNQTYSNIQVSSYLSTATINTIGNITTTGNLITAGGRIDSGYQFYSPTANIAVTANVNVSRVILAPTGTIISFGANVILPAGNVDAKVITISSNVTIAQLAVYAPVGTSVSPGGNITLGAGNVAQYFYHSATTKWYKVG